MDREILFRGKRIDNGEWMYGNLLRTDDDGTCIIQNHIPHHLLKNHEVSPKTVCQYTGLTDRNGRRFEGDIFQASDGEYFQRYIITWSEDLLGWYAECVGDSDGTLPLSEFRVGDIEVIGNIFDNPEMLEGGAE